ncbi:hypothetical protein cypCar_00037810 [Cyprinus carpio]|nr:hypothetical protein cypCar_00037810 [Cyprinus carpio]
MLKSSCLWLGRLMLFPSWNYIPHDAPAAGYLELLDPPVCVTLEAMAFDPGGALSEVMSVTRAAELLTQRCEEQACVCVSGRVSVVCPPLVIRGKQFFCLVLSEAGSSVPVFISLHNVHFLYRASPFAPHVVLCACLRSSLQVTAFSRLSSKVEVSGSHGPLQCLLLEKNLGASQYLWLCYCQNAVAERLCPRWVRAERVCVVAERLLDFVCDAEQKTQKKRNIYREMIQEPHQCPVTTFCVWWPSAALWSVRQLSDWMRREVWASLSLPSLLPPSAAHMTALELNAALSWSVHEVPLTDVSPEPLLLVGVLELDSTRATLQLRDQTHALSCLCVSTHQSGARTAHINTAWQGSDDYQFI